MCRFARLQTLGFPGLGVPNEGLQGLLFLYSLILAVGGLSGRRI